MKTLVTRSNDSSLGRLTTRAAGFRIALLPDQVLTLEGDRRGFEIICQSGPLWVTQPHDPADYLLSNGETFKVSKRGTVVIQGVRQGALAILSPMAAG
jgi:hypothetical protein